MTIDITNKFLVADHGGKIVIMRPPMAPLSKDDALLLAAYLVTLSLATDEEWQGVREGTYIHESLDSTEGVKYIGTVETT